MTGVLTKKNGIQKAYSVKTQAEYHLRAKELRGQQKPGEASHRFSQSSEGNRTANILTATSRTETINFCCLGHLVCDPMLQHS